MDTSVKNKYSVFYFIYNILIQMCLICHISNRWRLSMCLCKQHVPVIRTCTNIMSLLFKIGVKIKANFMGSGSLQLCVTCPTISHSCSYLNQDSITPDIAAHIIYKVIISSLIYWGKGGGGLKRYTESCISFFFFSFLLIVNNLSTWLGLWYVPATSSLELPDHLIYNTYSLPRTPDTEL